MNSSSDFFHFGFVFFQTLISLNKLPYMQGKISAPKSNHCHKVYYTFKNPNNNITSTIFFLHMLSVLAVSETNPNHSGLKQ